MNPQLAPTIAPDTLLAASSNQVSCDVSGETVILSLKDATYFGLDPIATRIWELLKGQRTIAQVCEVLLSEYDVDAERCMREVVALSGQLVEWGLVEVIADSPGRLTTSREVASETGATR